MSWLKNTHSSLIQSMNNLTEDTERFVDRCGLSHSRGIVASQLYRWKRKRKYSNGVWIGYGKKHALLFSDPAKSTKLIFPVRAVDRSHVTLSGQHRALHTLVLLYIQHADLQRYNSVRSRGCPVQERWSDRSLLIGLTVVESAIWRQGNRETM